MRNLLLLLLYPLICFQGDIYAQALDNATVDSLYAKISDLSQRIQKLEQELSFKEQELYAYPLPERMTFCGEEIDLNRSDIREKIEEEWLYLLGNRHLIYLWQNQSIHSFPKIEEIAKKLNTCDELKYLSLIANETNDQQENTKNWWGLSTNIAKTYGLYIDQYIDERADLAQSTELTLQSLKNLRLEFSSWTLALTAHKIGANKLNQLINSQSTSEFWHLDIENPKVEKEIIRLMVVKEIMTHLKDYHFMPKRKKVEEMTVAILVPTKRKFQGNLIKLSLFLSIPVKQLKTLNPSIIDQLPTQRPFRLIVPMAVKEQALEVLGLEPSFIVEHQNEPNKETQPPEPILHIHPTPTEIIEIKDQGVVEIEAKPQETVTEVKVVEVFKGNQVKHQLPTTTEQKEPENKDQSNLGQPKLYVVKNGDSFWKISRKFSVTAEEIKLWNEIVNDQLQIGQTLKIYKSKASSQK